MAVISFKVIEVAIQTTPDNFLSPRLRSFAEETIDLGYGLASHRLNVDGVKPSELLSLIDGYRVYYYKTICEGEEEVYLVPDK